MADYTVTVKVPFTFRGAGADDSDSLTAVALAYVLDAVSEHGNEGLAEDVSIKIKKKKEK